MNILLTGSTGFIGEQLLKRLVSDGHQVMACTRRLNKYPLLPCGASQVEMEFSKMHRPSDWLPYLADIDAVINCVGIIAESGSQSFQRLHNEAPAALFRACEHAGVPKVVQISALGAEPDKPARYHSSKAAADEVLKTLSLNWTIFKPSIVYGPGAKSMALFKALSSMPIVPLVGDGQQQIQPVYIDDLVAAILSCLQGRILENQSIDVVGPEPITFAELIKKLGHWFGKNRVYTLATPAMLVSTFAPLGRYINEPALNKESIGMLLQGNTADSQPFTKCLGYSPKSVDHVLQDTPVTQADRWHAGLYFLRPTLNVATALIWLWAGWVSAFVYPIESSYLMLDQVGIPRTLAPFVLYGASAFDFALGIAMLLRWKLGWIVFFQITIMAAYTVAISIALPEYWLHPFGPVVKNIPVLVATLILLILEEKKS